MPLGPRGDDISAPERSPSGARDYSSGVTEGAVWALDEERARAVLLRAISTSICLHMNDAERFSRWVEAQ